jgi:hypothetical protein
VRPSRLVLIAALLVAAGCAPAPVPVAVHGRVTYRGAPLRSGLIVFTPDDARGHHGPPAQAAIGSDGRYVLRTGTATGAAPGWYRVTVASLDTVAGESLPARFRDPELSDLFAEVLAGQDNSVDLDLAPQ